MLVDGTHGNTIQQKKWANAANKESETDLEKVHNLRLECCALSPLSLRPGAGERNSSVSTDTRIGPPGGGKGGTCGALVHQI